MKTLCILVMLSFATVCFGGGVEVLYHGETTGPEITTESIVYIRGLRLGEATVALEDLRANGFERLSLRSDGAEKRDANGKYDGWEAIEGLYEIRGELKKTEPY